jgi:hypothetical protein
MLTPNNPIVMEVITAPEELVKARAQRERFDRNAAWFQQHSGVVYDQYRGKVICVSCEEVFAAESAKEALRQARAAHPDDDGRYTLYIPQERAVRIYAYSR